MTPTPTAPDGLGTLAGKAFAAYLAGERERLSELVDLVTPVLWNAARSQGGAPATCEDAIQTAFLQLVDRAESIHSERQRVLWQHISTLTPRCQELLRVIAFADRPDYCLLYTSPSPRDLSTSRMPSSA